MTNQKKPVDKINGWNNQTDTGNYHVRYRHGELVKNPTYTDGTNTVTYTGMTGSANFLFLDGHADTFRYGEVKCKNIATWY